VSRAVVIRLVTLPCPGPDARVRLITVGACPRCGVAFLARLEHLRSVRETLRVHGIVCPGGKRTGEYAAPFEAHAQSEHHERDDAPVRRRRS
jgi:hypothetical protein